MKGGSRARAVPNGDSPGLVAVGRTDTAGGLRRGERGERTRQWILTAAAEAFAAGGYLGVNLSDVVGTLGLTKGALYYFFPTKEALAREIVELHFAQWRNLNKTALENVDNRLDALVEMSYGAARMFQANPITRAGARLALEANLINIDLPLPFAGWVDRVTAILEDGQTRGEVVGGIDARQAAETIVVYFHGAQEVSRALDDRRDLLVRIDYFWRLMLPVLRPAGDPDRSDSLT